MDAPATPRRDADGRWLCNVTADCTAPAVAQRAFPMPTGDDPKATVPAMACDTHAAALDD